MNMIRVGLFASCADAEEIRNRLARAAIRAELQEESPLARLWFISRRAAGFRLEVPAADVARAQHLLAQWDSAPGERHRAIRCPECRSMRVEYPQFTRKFFLPNLVMGLIAELGLLPKEYYCEDCHFTWGRKTAFPRARRHMAPRYFIEDDQPTASDTRRRPEGGGRDVPLEGTAQALLIGLAFSGLLLGAFATTNSSARDANIQGGSTPWTAPARAARKKNPIPADASAIAKGKALYISGCFPCHGPAGKGDGPAAATLERNGAPIRPGNLSDPKRWQETDGELFWKITEGNTPMPAWGQTLTDEQRWLIVDYIRTLAPKPATNQSGSTP
jgi:mono/diheme cytochrome c family protein